MDRLQSFLFQLVEGRGAHLATADSCVMAPRGLELLEKKRSIARILRSRQGREGTISITSLISQCTMATLFSNREVVNLSIPTSVATIGELVQTQNHEEKMFHVGLSGTVTS